MGHSKCSAGNLFLPILRPDQSVSILTILRLKTFFSVFLSVICLWGILANNAFSADKSVSLSGSFSIKWGDPQDPGGSPIIRYELIDDDGVKTELLLDEKLLRPLGGPRALNRKRVKVEGERVDTPKGAVRVFSIEINSLK